MPRTSSLPALVAELCGIEAEADIEVGLQPCHGGDIHRSFAVSLTDPAMRATTNQPRWFVKCNEPQYSDVLRAEFASLQQFDKLLPGAYPKPIAVGGNANHACLVLEYRHMAALAGDSHQATELGQLLAKQHAIYGTQFGWDDDNHIGTTPQYNGWDDDWIEFYRTRRLLPQLRFALGNGLPQALAEQVQQICAQLQRWFENYQPAPSLLHGDLWAGNAAYDGRLKRPLLFDPAPYYGDAETDLAMTELFGRFPAAFYSAYAAHRAIDSGYPSRRPLYQLYHALNHFNLFGNGYAPLVVRCLAELSPQLSPQL